MLPKYDVILVAAAMYLRETEFVDVVSAVREYCHKETVVLITTPGQYYGDGLYEYLKMAELALGNGANVLMRPKLWWLEKLTEAGLDIVGDVGGHGLLARSGNYDRIRPNLGSSIGIDAEFTFDRQDGRIAAFGEVWLHRRRTGLSIGFSYERGDGFHQIGEVDPGEQLRATAPELADILCYFRNGSLGSERRVQFLPFSQYVYAPGAICRPADNVYHVGSDPYF